jgi:hypothetical protein
VDTRTKELEKAIQISRNANSVIYFGERNMLLSVVWKREPSLAAGLGDYSAYFTKLYQFMRLYNDD